MNASLRSRMFALVISGGWLIASQPQAYAVDAHSQRRPIDLVICLDTSGSMTNLIDSARAKLWEIVNELSQVKPLPHFRVGLLTYGSPSNSSMGAGWINFQSNLTDDLDTVYAKMMEMQTSGGDEFVGWVLHDAFEKMDWSRNPNALKLIFVAGNESADQARSSHDFRDIARQAQASEVTINAIFAGERDRGIIDEWHTVAALGGGDYSAIDAAKGTRQIDTPYDHELTRLNRQLNSTYISYGAHGAAGAANQIAQDANAARMGNQCAASRAAAKAGGLYQNAYWDLVDAVQKGDIKLDTVEQDQLPKKMRNMSHAQRRAYVEGMRATRNTVQAKIAEVGKLRAQLLREEAAKNATDHSSLDEAMIQSLRRQARAKGFVFE